MGEKQTKPFQLSFNGLLKVDFQGSHVTSDGGLILVRELDERLGLGELIDEHLSDSRQGTNKQFTLADLLRQSVYSRLAGYEDLNDAERVSIDPTFRLIGSQKIWDRGAALTSTLHGFETEMLASKENLLGLMALNRELVGQAEVFDDSERVVLDMDSTESPVHGQQEGSAYNGHFELSSVTRASTGESIGSTRAAPRAACLSDPSGTYLFGVSEGNLGSETRNTEGIGGFHLADFYLGLPNFVGTATGLDLRERDAYHALFVQDDWKVSPKLTVNFGVRWDVQFPFAELGGQFTGFDENADNPGVTGYNGALDFYGSAQGANGRTRVGDPTWGNFGPLAGLAYQINDKLMFRAGGGVQYMAIQNGNVRFVPRTGYEARGNPPPKSAPQDTYFQWDNQFPSNILGTPPFIDPTFLNNQNLTNWMNPNTIGVPPVMYFLTAGFQRQFDDWVMEATMYSNMGRNNADHERINDLAPQYWSLGPLLNLPITHPDVLAAGFAQPFPEFPADLPLHRALRRFPQYGNISNDAGINTGMNYNAFMLKATRRYSNGLSFLGHWTLAKQLGDVDWAPGAFGSNTRNSYNRRLDKRVNRYDTTHRVVLNYSYDLPFGPGKKYGGGGFSKYVMGGWTVAGIHEYVNGFPLSTGGGLSVGIPGGVLNLANRPAGAQWRSNISCGDMVFGDSSRDFILNAGNPSQELPNRPVAWVPSGDYVEGNAPEVDQEARQCPNFRESFSLLKQIPITERVNILLGADCFNCLNRQRWIAGRFGNNITSSSFGKIVVEQPKGGGRTIQLRMRIQW